MQHRQKGRARNGLAADRERRRGHETDAIVPRHVYDKGARGVGYGHKFTLGSELMVDRLVLGALGVEPGDDAPYVVSSPRHVTTVPFMDLDPRSIQYLQIARNVEREAFQQALRELGYDPAIRKAQIEARVIEIHAIGSRAVVAEIDSVPINLSRGIVTRVFSEAGVGMPEMHAPHFKIGIADTKKTQNQLRNVSREVLIDEIVSVGQIDAYFDTYTELLRPEFIPE